MSDEQHWWYCLRHRAVEPDAGCPGKDRLGPFPTREAAAHALDTIHQRNEEWDTADDRPDAPGG